MSIDALPRWILIGLIAITFGVSLWGIQKDLPYVPEFDEPIYVEKAVTMASSGDLNPHWFGNPASTVIYPLAAIYHGWYVITYREPLLAAAPNLSARFEANPGQFYLLGRYLTVIFMVLSIPLVYQLGRRAFGTPTGLIGSWLFIVIPIVIFHAQIVRTDLAATFFGLFSLWLCLRLYRRPTLTDQLLTGVSIGLAIATRYFMVALIPILLIVDGLIWWEWRASPQSSRRSISASQIGTGLLGLGAGFVLSTPYFFLDFRTALQNLTVEARQTHLGVDGLSPLGNLVWYLTQATASSLTWPIALLAAIGIILILTRRRFPQLLLLAFTGIFLAGISVSPLHWQRWLIQILPLFTLFAAEAVQTIVPKLSGFLNWGKPAQQGLIVALVLLVSVWPCYQLISNNIRQSRPSTRILAREWILQNLPAGSQIAQEAYAVPLADTDFTIFENFSLATTDYTLDEAYRGGFRYIVVSSTMYQRYFAEPDRYAAEVNSYQALFNEGHLLQEFEPSATRDGPTIRIYELRDR